MAKKDPKKEVEKNYPEFVDVVAGLNIQELEKRILMYTKERENVLDSKEKDETLIKTAALKKELEAPYRDSIKAISLKTKYLFQLLSEKGGDTNGSGEHSKQ